MRLNKAIVVVLSLFSQQCKSFIVLKAPKTIYARVKAKIGSEAPDRLSSLSNVFDFHFKSVAKILLTMVASSIVMDYNVTPTMAASIDTVNSKLSNYGLSPILYVPSGFAPVVSEFGRGNLKSEINSPIVVQFAHPKAWVLQTTSLNGNGESGTISANDYFKGDSAFFFVDTQPISNSGSEKSFSANSKDLIQSFIQNALSQKGDPAESLKIVSIKDIPNSSVNKQPYVEVEFTYQLNTEAGFLVERHAVLSLTSIDAAEGRGAVSSRTASSAATASGDGVGQLASPSAMVEKKEVPKEQQKITLQGLVAVTTGKRWRSGMDTQLRLVAQSFRVNRLNSGVFATTPVVTEKYFQ